MLTRSSWILAAAAMLLSQSSCGSVAEEGYLGDPFYELEANIDDVQDILNSNEELQTSLFWSATGDTTTEAQHLLTQSVLALEFVPPSRMRIIVYEEPSLQSQRPYELGLLLIWHDANANGRYDNGEIRGGAIDNVVLFAKRALGATQSPTKRPLQKGFSVLSTGTYCDELSTLPPGEDCGVELGGACIGDTECGAGRCLTSDGSLEFPGGYCIVTEEAGCQPEGGAIHGISTDEGGTSAWAKACAEDSECRVEEGYHCSADFGSCLPKQPVSMEVWPDFEIEPLCSESLF